MDFADELKALTSSIADKLKHIQTEEAAKTSLVMPFIKIMGYNIFDITEVVPEFDANVGAAKKYKLDYAILQDGKPIILIECKKPGDKLDDSFSQLFHYFSATEARIGILTDGVKYLFFADLEKTHKMDNCPFLEIDFLNLSDTIIPELKKLTKSGFNLEDAISTAKVLKYTGGIKTILKEQLTNPNEDFVKFFFKQLCPNKTFTGKLKESFVEFTKKSFEEFIREEIVNSIDEVRKPKPVVNPEVEEEQTPSSSSEENKDNPQAIVTTKEELEGFYIIKAILGNKIETNRISYKDTINYRNVLFDNKTSKPICRLYLNTSKWKIGVFTVVEGKKQEEKISIEKLDDLYQYSDKFEQIVKFYDKN